MSNQEQPSVYAITSASTGLSFDQAGRKRRYLISRQFFQPLNRDTRSPLGSYVQYRYAE